MQNDERVMIMIDLNVEQTSYKESIDEVKRRNCISLVIV